jgi:23S rRNA (adenine2030-N6)-methyltransferase
MNYRHAFHAGNFADVVKHVIWLELLASLQAKPGALCVLDTHAGRASYDLANAAASRTAEFQQGITRVWDARDAPTPVARYLAYIRAFNRARGNGDGLRWYPGSPQLLRAGLRAQDRLIACERVADEHAALKLAFHGDAQAAVHARDAWEALHGLLPPREKRGLVLIDPPYEPPALDAGRARQGLTIVRQRFATAVVALWYPIKDSASHARWLRQLAALALGDTLVIELCVRPPVDRLRLNGSGVVVVNPPWGVAERVNTALAWLWQRLAIDGGGRYGCQRLVPGGRRRS